MAVFQGVRTLRFRDALGQCEARDLSQLEAAEVLGVSERTFRRWCRRFEGEGEAGLVDGTTREARFFEPGGLSVSERVLYVADTNNHVIRTVDLDTGDVASLEVDF